VQGVSLEAPFLFLAFVCFGRFRAGEGCEMRGAAVSSYVAEIVNRRTPHLTTVLFGVSQPFRFGLPSKKAKNKKATIRA
jgi:hypothetical protein